MDGDKTDLVACVIKAYNAGRAHGFEERGQFVTNRTYTAGLHASDGLHRAMEATDGFEACERLTAEGLACLYFNGDVAANCGGCRASDLGGPCAKLMFAELLGLVRGERP